MNTRVFVVSLGFIYSSYCLCASPTLILAPDGGCGVADKILNNNVTWGMLNHIHFHFGRTVSWNYGLEAYYGFSNGVAWYPSFLQFNERVRIAIGDFHVNAIDFVYDFVRGLFCEYKAGGLLFKNMALWNLLGNFHILSLSFDFAAFIKVKLLSVGGIVTTFLLGEEGCFFGTLCDYSTKAYRCKKMTEKFSIPYFVLRPLIQLDVEKMMNVLFNKSEEDNW